MARILTLNLGSTSTKLGVFDDARVLCADTLRHSRLTMPSDEDVDGQTAFRRQAVEAWLHEKGYSIQDMDLFASRCGLIRPVPGGLFEVDDVAVDDALSGRYGWHVSNLGLLLCRQFATETGKPALFVDAPVTNEMPDVAKVSGYAPIKRHSKFHALNAKRIARLHAARHGLQEEDSRFIVIHMGGGVTVSALYNLKAVDVNNGVDGDGPFSPERVGSLTHVALFDLLDIWGGDAKALRDDLYRRGGLYSYTGSNDVRELVERAETDPWVALAIDGMIYQIAKQIASMAVPLEGRVDAILLTGGLAHARRIVDPLIERVNFLAPCAVYPGEDELAALAEGAVRYLQGEALQHVGDYPPDA